MRFLARSFTILLALSVPPRAARAQVLVDADGLAPTETADADRQQAVTELMRTGIREYRRQNLEAARKAFAEAWRLKRHPAIAFSLAEVEMKLGLYREASDHLRYYIERSNAEHASDRADAEAEVRECRKHLGTVRVMMDPRDARLFVDNEAVEGEGQERIVLLEPGEHTFRAESGVRSSSTERIVVAAGQELALALAMPPELAKPTSAAVAAPHGAVASTASTGGNGNGGGGHARTAALVAGGVLTVAAIAVGVGYTLAAASTRNERDQLIRQVESAGDPELAKRNASCTPPEGIRPPQCDGLAAKNDEVYRQTNLSTVAYATGGAFAAATAAMYFLWPHARTARPLSTAFAVAPWSPPGVHGVRLRLDF